tara:strand:- start:86 stop:499 length:414 start_codon:yes stop_codon:yes gene_type:complete
MEQQQTYGVKSWGKAVVVTALVGLFLGGCSGLSRKPETEIKVVTKIVPTTIPTVAQPKPIQLNDTRVWVVTAEKLDEFIADFKEQYGEVAFVALSMRDYENLALNIGDLKRYINQQKEIIIYYEKAVTEEPKEPEKK